MWKAKWKNVHFMLFFVEIKNNETTITLGNYGLSKANIHTSRILANGIKVLGNVSQKD